MGFAVVRFPNRLWTFKLGLLATIPDWLDFTAISGTISVLWFNTSRHSPKSSKVSPNPVLVDMMAMGAICEFSKAFPSLNFPLSFAVFRCASISSTYPTWLAPNYFPILGLDRSSWDWKRPFLFIFGWVGWVGFGVFARNLCKGRSTWKNEESRPQSF